MVPPQDTGPHPDDAPLVAGTPAPEFRLAHAPRQYTRLSELRGHPVILAFYPADWSPVCATELSLFNELLGEFGRHQARLLAISVDSAWCHQAYARARHLQFALLADFEPKGAVARAYGAYRVSDGTASRALFVIDGHGMIQWSYVSPIDINPGADGILAALDALPRPNALHGTAA